VLDEDNEQFLEGIFEIEGRDFVDAGIVSSQIKKGLKNRGISEQVIRRVAVVTFEAEVNIISYARHGTISYYVLDDSVIIEANDSGPGIKDIELALQEGYSTADDSIRELGFGAGMGLSNIRKSSDEFDLSSVPGKGTYLRSVILLNGKSQSEDK
jgi:serine/threonine-protein kinase RsbT